MTCVPRGAAVTPRCSNALAMIGDAAMQSDATQCDALMQVVIYTTMKPHTMIVGLLMMIVLTVVVLVVVIVIMVAVVLGMVVVIMMVMMTYYEHSTKKHRMGAKFFIA